MTIAKSLAKLARAAGLNQKQLADAAGIGTASISRYLTGDQLPGLAALAAIGRALEISPADLGRLVYGVKPCGD